MILEPSKRDNGSAWGWWLKEYGYHFQGLLQRVIDPDTYALISRQAQGIPLNRLTEVYLPDTYILHFETAWESYLADWKGHQSTAFALVTIDESSRLWVTPQMMQPVWQWMPRRARYLTLTPPEVMAPLPKLLVVDIPAYDRVAFTLWHAMPPKDWQPEPSILKLPLLA